MIFSYQSILIILLYSNSKIVTSITFFRNERLVCVCVCVCIIYIYLYIYIKDIYYTGDMHALRCDQL